MKQQYVPTTNQTHIGNVMLAVAAELASVLTGEESGEVDNEGAFASMSIPH